MSFPNPKSTVFWDKLVFFKKTKKWFIVHRIMYLRIYIEIYRNKKIFFQLIYEYIYLKNINYLNQRFLTCGTQRKSSIKTIGMNHFVDIKYYSIYLILTGLIIYRWRGVIIWDRCGSFCALNSYIAIIFEFLIK